MSMSKPMSKPKPKETLRLPPDANESVDIGSLQNLRRLSMAWPVIYIPYLVLLLASGIATIAFLVKAIPDGLIAHRDPVSGEIPYSASRRAFWIMLLVVIGVGFSILVLIIMQLMWVPSFWRGKAIAFVRSGGFGPTGPSGLNTTSKRSTILEIGPHGGDISAVFASEIIAAQRSDAAGSSSPFAPPTSSLPIFVGYGKWSRWFRLPNGPKYYLQTLFDAGIPREHIVANRVLVNRVSHQSNLQLRLPYADNSISLIVCNLGLSDVCKWFNVTEHKSVFKEMARVLEPEGKMIVVQNHALDRRFWRSITSGPMASYKRVLVQELGWPETDAKTGWAWGVIHFLEAVKPSTEVWMA